jgi:hypothetical protein
VTETFGDHLDALYETAADLILDAERSRDRARAMRRDAAPIRARIHLSQSRERGDQGRAVAIRAEPLR